MDGYSGDEFSSDGEFNSSVNSIIDPNDIVLNDGSDGEKGNLTKGPWGPEEDKWLINFVTINGEGNWRRVATELERTPKSCRLRWCNQLNPKINHRPFTPAEDKIIVSMIKKGGRNGKWSVIAKILEFRTDNQVKNRWNSKLRKQYGNLRKKNPSRMRSAKAAHRNVKGRLSSTSNAISPPSPTLASVNPYLPPAFVVSTPSLWPAPAFNRLTSLSLCPPGHETYDVLNPGIFINPSGLCPSPSQQ
ncbi:hypothetical protein QQ045_000659 [Rhodiola kirilowii]